jgi:transposase
MQPQAEKAATATATELVTQTLLVIKELETRTLETQERLRELRSLITCLLETQTQIKSAAEIETETQIDKGRDKDSPYDLTTWLELREEVAKQLGKEVEASLTLDQLAALRRRRREERLRKEFGRALTRYPLEIIL